MPEDQVNDVAEEQAADEQGLATVDADELRGKLAEDFGLDPEENAEILDKLVERETENRERLSKTIKQKISWRERAQGSKKPPEKGDGKKPAEKQDVDQLVDQRVKDALEMRDLKDLNLSEEIESKVLKLAQLEGLSVREAAKDSYIQSLIEKEKQAERINKATPKRTGKGSYKTSIDPSQPLDPDDFDLNTQEGQQAWKDAKAARAKYERENK